MRRITVSLSPPDRHSGSDLHSWSKGDSFRDEVEVEAALSTLDNELDQTEDALTEWSRGFSVTPSSYLSGLASSPSFTSSSSVYTPFTNTLQDASTLSTITERTENPSSRPTSYNVSVLGSRPVSDAIRHSAVPLHSRGATKPSNGTPSRRTGDFTAFFEYKYSSDNSSRPYSPYGHRRTGSAPAGPCSPYLYTQTSQSIPTFGTTDYGYGGSYSRLSSLGKSWSSQSQSYTSSETPTYSNTFTSTSHGFTLRRPQTSPRLPLSSVRNIVAAWKCRSPYFDKSCDHADAMPEEGFFSMRQQAERGFLRERNSMGGPALDQDVPSTPRTSASLTPSGIVPPPFDLAELGTSAKGSQEVSRSVVRVRVTSSDPPASGLLFAYLRRLFVSD